MKRLFLIPLLSIVAFSFSCKKFIRQQEEKAVMNIIVNGYWHVDQYIRDGNDVTASFSGYLFKFESNGAVTGKNADNSVSESGTWAPDVDARTISSNFPSASEPVNLLNGVWKIKDSGSDFVLANLTDSVTHTSNILRLKK